ncbi:DUF72 domain-containing protein [Parathalassolituus penaei]|uniref:DUF72 domain-containing protein n=1 Tax=Parathalassolituus penaei TaxID=2997323 RepID=A0A9X3IUS0_9GAMM|nr:DUF72 domain-containing protein [Parathalassolituus penaei]MCY0966473.1 DUF72 domain-containing protein [Parathalassolituus penaei]
MWYLPEWRGNLLSPGCTPARALTEYSQLFGSVEGNTTFYALPDRMRLQGWLDQASEHFRFCFKVPRDISHAADPLEAWNGKPGALFRGFLDQILAYAPHKLGVVLLQLPATFSAERMSALFACLDQLVMLKGVVWALECRHLSFFDKSLNEQQLLRGLADRGVDRVMFDSRGLFHDDSATEEILDARRKKPRMPVHAVATGNNPVVRFIGHSQYEPNRLFLQQWHKRIVQWQSEGKTPWVFWHTAGNRDVGKFYRWTMANIWNQTITLPGEVGGGVTPDLWG